MALLIWILLGLLFVSIAKSDAADPKYIRALKIMDVQGAKYVSEGAYFYFEVTNKINQTLTLTVSFSQAFVYDGNLTVYLTTAGHGLYGLKFNLNVNESMVMLFHAPRVKEADIAKAYSFSFREITQDARIVFRVVVVDLQWLLNNTHKQPTPEPLPPGNPPLDGHSIETMFGFGLIAIGFTVVVLSLRGWRQKKYAVE